MTRIRFCAVLLLLAVSPVVAAEQVLSGPEIERALSDVTVEGVKDGRTWSQRFWADGRTAYREKGAPDSFGRWRIEGDRYCSVWSPSKDWSCWTMMRDGETVIFVSQDGERWPARPEK